MDILNTTHSKDRNTRLEKAIDHQVTPEYVRATHLLLIHWRILLLHHYLFWYLYNKLDIESEKDG